MTFVTNHVLGRHDVAGGLNELDREGSECRRSFVGQLISVLDEALRKDPVSECSGDQVENSQGSLFAMGSLGSWDFWNGFEFEVSGDGLCCEVSQDAEWKSKDVEEAETRQSKLIIDGSFCSVGQRVGGSRDLIDRGVGDVVER